MKEAFEIATSGRPGPVVIALPEDMLTEESDAPALKPETAPHFAPTHKSLEEARALLAGAKKPLVIVGGGNWTESAIADFENSAKRRNCPVITGFRRQDMFRNDHDCYVGRSGYDHRSATDKGRGRSGRYPGRRHTPWRNPDQGYTIISPGIPKQKLIHVYPDSTELNKVYKAAVAIHSSSIEFAKAVQVMRLDGAGWKEWKETLRKRYLDWSTIKTRDKFTLDMDGVIQDMLSVLPPDTVITTDAGNFSGWAQRFIRYNRPMRLLAPTSGAMGYGAPAAVAASLACPERVVVGFMGDGGFLMTGQNRNGDA
jgi:acetolactate synthase-1/2/3 large subunit